MFWVYILCSLRNGKLYIGHTDDLRRRLAERNEGRGGQFTRQNGPWELVHSEAQQDRTAAVRRERFLKSVDGSQEDKRLAGVAQLGWSVLPTGRPRCEGQLAEAGPSGEWAGQQKVERSQPRRYSDSMLTREDVRNRREAILEVAGRYGAHDVRVFGSVARADATEGSDLDLIVRFESDRSLLDHGGLTMDLRELLGVKVDAIDEEAMRERFRDHVSKKAIPL